MKQDKPGRYFLIPFLIKNEEYVLVFLSGSFQPWFLNINDLRIHEQKNLRKLTEFNTFR